MGKIKLAIADDSLQLQKALVTVFEAEKDFELVLRANNGLDLLAKLKVVTCLPDIILMDIQMPEMSGIDATKHIHKHYPSIKIIAFSQFDNEPNVLKMYSLGVKSFIGKDDGMDTLFNAIKVVHGGGGVCH
jgi:DNA-binding NarL/FixJ family response regulator